MHHLIFYNYIISHIEFQYKQKLPIFFRIRGADCTFNSCYIATTDVGEVAKPLILLGFNLIPSSLDSCLYGNKSNDKNHLKTFLNSTTHTKSFVFWPYYPKLNHKKNINSMIFFTKLCQQTYRQQEL